MIGRLPSCAHRPSPGAQVAAAVALATALASVPASAQPVPSAAATAADSAPPPPEKPARPKRPKRPRTPLSPRMKAELALWDDQLATARKGAIAQLVGANLFVWPYVPSLVVGALALDASVELGVATGLGWLCVPVVGPFMTAALSDDLDDAGRGVLLADGVLQSAGALTFLVGTVIRKNAEHTSPWAAGRAPTTASFQIAPVVTPAITGVGLSGSF